MGALSGRLPVFAGTIVVCLGGGGRGCLMVPFALPVLELRAWRF